MKPERMQEVEQIYYTAQKLESGQRAAFLEKACGGDETLRQEVESRLGKQPDAEVLMESPSPEVETRKPAEDKGGSLVGRQIGPYKILSLLGVGGMGQVYLAEDPRLDRTIALKILPAEFALDKERMQRFVREAKAASALKHSNVAHIYEISECNGIHFIAMEYVEGQTLAARMKGRPLDCAEIVEIGTQVADALDEAHSKGITHRDIKSANIMLTRRRQVKVLDFGLAKMTRPEKEGMGSDLSTEVNTVPGVVMGTVEYMSPEQVLGHEVDQRSDIFSLGVLLYEMATGRRPFSGASANETIDHILHKQPDAVARFNYNVPAELDRIIRKCLEKDRERRYQFIRDLLTDFRNLKRDSDSAGVMAAAKSQERWQRLLRPSSLLVAAAMVLILVGTLIYNFRFRNAPAGIPAFTKSLAVLPLENLSRDPTQDFFSDGMTDALITNLAQIQTLRVISRTSVMQYKGTRSKSLREIAKELNVGAVLEGTVLWSGDRVRISAQLIEADTDRHLWAKNYERDLRDILAMQSEVAQAVAQEIRVKMTPSEKERLAKFRPVKREAYEAYLRGANDRDKSQLERAIKLDPEYAPAYTALARIYYFDGLFGELPPGESFPKMKTLALTGLQKDETLGEAHAWLALANLHYDWNWVEAEKEFRRALELSPSNADVHHDYAHYLLVMDRLNESMAESKRAIELNPFDTGLIACVGWHCLYSSQYDQSVEYSLKALAMDPTHPYVHLSLGWTYEQKLMFKEAIAEFKNAVSGWDSVLVNAALGHGFAVSGDRRHAEEILAKLKERSKRGYVSAYDIAVVHQGLGDKDQAFEWLEKAYAERSGFLIHVKWDPRFASLHSDPRFQNLIRRIGLPPSSDSRKLT